jgi:hypothetical protein
MLPFRKAELVSTDRGSRARRERDGKNEREVA